MNPMDIHNSANKSTLDWQEFKGTVNCAPLSCAGHYVISHRPAEYTLSYRPPSEHHHIGTYETLSLAKAAACRHDQGAGSTDYVEDAYRRACSGETTIKR